LTGSEPAQGALRIILTHIRCNVASDRPDGRNPEIDSTGMKMAKKEKLDPEVEELIKWCIEVEGFLVAGGATLAQAQQHIEEQVEWFTDMFYDGLTPEQAAKEALN
jgi:pyridoxine 5'-phosphate synthase PdxJ